MFVDVLPGLLLSILLVRHDVRLLGWSGKECRDSSLDKLLGHEGGGSTCPRSKESVSFTIADQAHLSVLRSETFLASNFIDTCLISHTDTTDLTAKHQNE